MAIFIEQMMSKPGALTRSLSAFSDGSDSGDVQRDTSTAYEGNTDVPLALRPAANALSNKSTMWAFIAAGAIGLALLLWLNRRD